ncbi:MAG: zinc metallopeptidase [Bacteroidetes bacterium]|nr:zinc metallopeptidase [Bacteroidota bacterium]
MISYIILMIIVLIPSWIVSSRFKSKIKKYTNMPLMQGMSGKEVAEKMLSDHGIYDVGIKVANGILSDHYNPQTKSIGLSQQIFNGRSVASAAIAAHECGHAVQHAKAYSFLKFRSALVPVVSFSSRIITWVILAGILLINIFPQLLLAGIVLFALTTLFSFVTLPVEFDASKRAVKWLEIANITADNEQIAVKDGLKWAAMTYVVAAIGSLATLVYYIMIFLGRRS